MSEEYAERRDESRPARGRLNAMVIYSASQVLRSDMYGTLAWNV